MRVRVCAREINYNVVQKGSHTHRYTIARERTHARISVPILLFDNWSGVKTRAGACVRGR